MRYMSFEKLLKLSKEMVEFGILESLQRNDEFKTFNEELRRIFDIFKFINYQYNLDKNSMNEEEKI